MAAGKRSDDASNVPFSDLGMVASAIGATRVPWREEQEGSGLSIDLVGRAMALSRELANVWLLPSPDTMATMASAICRFLETPPRAGFEAPAARSGNLALADSSHELAGPEVALVLGSRVDQVRWTPWLVGVASARPMGSMPGTTESEPPHWGLRPAARDAERSIPIPCPSGSDGSPWRDRLAALSWEGSGDGWYAFRAALASPSMAFSVHTTTSDGFAEQVLLCLTRRPRGQVSEEHSAVIRLALEMCAEALAVALPQPVSGERVLVTPPEAAIAKWLARGFTGNDIAQMIDRSPHTVHDHIKSLHRKLGVNSRSELLARVLGVSRDASTAVHAWAS